MTLLYLTESEKLAWDLYFGLMITKANLPGREDIDEAPYPDGGIEWAASIADRMIEQRRLRYMPRHDAQPAVKP